MQAASRIGKAVPRFSPEWFAISWGTTWTEEQFRTEATAAMQKTVPLQQKQKMYGWNGRKFLTALFYHTFLRMRQNAQPLATETYRRLRQQQAHNRQEVISCILQVCGKTGASSALNSWLTYLQENDLLHTVATFKAALQSAAKLQNWHLCKDIVHLLKTHHGNIPVEMQVELLHLTTEAEQYETAADALTTLTNKHNVFSSTSELCSVLHSLTKVSFWEQMITLVDKLDDHSNDWEIPTANIHDQQLITPLSKLASRLGINVLAKTPKHETPGEVTVKRNVKLQQSTRMFLKRANGFYLIQQAAKHKAWDRIDNALQAMQRTGVLLCTKDARIAASESTLTSVGPCSHAEDYLANELLLSSYASGNAWDKLDRFWQSLNHRIFKKKKTVVPFTDTMYMVMILSWSKREMFSEIDNLVSELLGLRVSTTTDIQGSKKAGKKQKLYVTDVDTAIEKLLQRTPRLLHTVIDVYYRRKNVHAMLQILTLIAHAQQPGQFMNVVDTKLITTIVDKIESVTSPDSESQKSPDWLPVDWDTTLQFTYPENVHKLVTMAVCGQRILDTNEFAEQMAEVQTQLDRGCEEVLTNCESWIHLVSTARDWLHWPECDQLANFCLHSRQGQVAGSSTPEGGETPSGKKMP
eukprot:TRINITY_DN2450_c0_g1_i1.p1 TRINITY_DN2450_c0_g1~~TRINITY_DN2450_c0_g1_i1.p1  ORF type:complete len:638 (-),score=21.04 TRINITY_DN2450_c0_g1_i1:34-1947(-)